MQTSLLILLFLAFGFMLMFIQRTEAKKRVIVSIGMLLVGILIVRFVNYRDIHAEAQIAFFGALILNALFWLLIGRYNPPGSSDDIQVIGMDD